MSGEPLAWLVWRFGDIGGNQVSQENMVFLIILFEEEQNSQLSDDKNVRLENQFGSESGFVLFLNSKFLGPN